MYGAWWGAEVKGKGRSLLGGSSGSGCPNDGSVGGQGVMSERKQGQGNVEVKGKRRVLFAWQFKRLLLFDR